MLNPGGISRERHDASSDGSAGEFNSNNNNSSEDAMPTLRGNAIVILGRGLNPSL